ncbi:MAG: DNA-3-methyladenine glycosylase [Cyclobacteriaceae bacterium]|jgi:DNA-3-methyladenine glycosylase
MDEFQNILTDKLKPEYYLGGNVVQLAKDLIGRVLVTNVGGVISKGVVVETEAYRGYNDKACHANNGKRTKRNEVMYLEGGKAYVYLCYGIHQLFNVVTNVEGKADAVLIRALHPIEGEENMTNRFPKVRNLLSNGPGVLTKAMGITLEMTNLSLGGNLIWLEVGVVEKGKLEITVSKRVGVNYAEEDAELPWRFYLKGNVNVSKS